MVCLYNHSISPSEEIPQDLPKHQLHLPLQTERQRNNIPEPLTPDNEKEDKVQRQSKDSLTSPGAGNTNYIRYGMCRPA